MLYNAGWITEPEFYSYDNNTWYGQPKNLMAFDITAIQAPYGVNSAFQVGNNAAGYVSWVGGISGGYIIANTVIIENAIGGSGNDLITGNTYDNNLQGREGDDTINAGAGNDRIEGGAGDDTLSLISNSTWSNGYVAKNTSNDFSVGANQSINLSGFNRFGDVIND